MEIKILERRSMLEAVGAVISLACGWGAHWFITRHDVPNAVKEAEARKDKLHAQELRDFHHQFGKLADTFRDIISDINSRNK